MQCRLAKGAPELERRLEKLVEELGREEGDPCKVQIRTAIRLELISSRGIRPVRAKPQFHLVVCIISSLGDGRKQRDSIGINQYRDD